ncbi:hypothetical protein LTR74_003974 [Friedmanniomyces endolithicus]|nr:hypothetical protein LTR74_003974 [Friedmanniomyces endolithicus]
MAPHASRHATFAVHVVVGAGVVQVQGAVRQLLIPDFSLSNVIDSADFLYQFYSQALFVWPGRPGVDAVTRRSTNAYSLA